MRSEKEIRERLRREITENIVDPRETPYVMALIKKVRQDLLKWVLGEE